MYEPSSEKVLGIIYIGESAAEIIQSLAIYFKKIYIWMIETNHSCSSNIFRRTCNNYLIVQNIIACFMQNRM